jgi:gamma-glutamyltranspeptidase/glutathione hydrolase
MASHRPTLYGTRHAVSSGHYLASAAAFTILQAGGNAVDAGCAAGIALGVLYPDIVNFAGVAPIIIRMADGTLETIAGLGHWPQSLPPDVFMREHGGRIPPGVRRTVVPAAPDAWITALSRHGTMSFSEVAQAAIGFARDGFGTYDVLANSLAAKVEQYQRWPSSAAIYLPGGRPPVVGERFVQTDLAATIQYMADQEKAARGGREAGLEAARSAFYRGDIAEKIVAFMRQEGGFLSAEDLANYRSPVTEAVIRKWRGHTVITCGPWCQGPALLEALLLVEQVGLDGMPHNSADYLHIVLECLKLAFADREFHFGDPARVDVPINHLLSENYIARRAAAVRSDLAYPEMPPPLDFFASHSLMPSMGELPKVDADTSYVCAVDRWGNAFSATPSDNSSDAPVVPGLGIVPSSRGSQSRPDPRHPSGVAPGKRPRLTPNPAMVLTADGGVMPLGTPGGDVQIQAMLQVILNHLHFGMDIQSAIEAPRVATYSFPNSFAPFDYFPGRIAVEARIDAPTQAALARLGHEVKLWPEWTGMAGCVEVIRTFPASGLLAAGADPRRAAYAVAC